MGGYGESLYEDAAQVRHTKINCSGSGRLIGKNLVVTARHVINGGDPAVDWIVGLTPPGAKKPIWYKARVVWVAKGDLDLALLEITSSVELHPKFRLRIAHLTAATGRMVQGHGYPDGAIIDGERIRMTPPGVLYYQGGETLAFGIEISFQPISPAQNWAGFSGSSIVHSRICDERDVWIYGVARDVPAAFNRQLTIAPLAKATHDPDFCQLLRNAGVKHIISVDPASLPAAEDFPDIKRIGDYAIERLKRPPGLTTMATTAALCKNMTEIDEIHRGHVDGKVGLSPESLLAEFKNGVVNLKTPGGSGKTFYLLQLVLASVEIGYVPFYLDLKDVSEDAKPSALACERLFSAASRKGVSWQTFLKALNDFPILVAVDSLNEARTVPQIEEILQFMVRDYGDRIFLIIADRLSEGMPKVPGQLATMLPLSADEVERRLKDLSVAQSSGSFRKLLSIPFFLALYEEVARHAPEPAARPEFQNRSDILYAYFAICNNSEVAPEKMKQAGRDIVRRMSPVAFDEYRSQSIILPQASFEEKLLSSRIDVQALLSAGMLIKESSGKVMFRHQLFHDFLAGYYLADPDDEFAGALRWNSGNFDTATLKAKSFDALEFAVELARKQADQLIIEVYDWNYRGAFHLILKSERDPSASLPANWNALRDALIILNSEKQFDPFQHTRLAAADRAAAIGQEIDSDYNSPNFEKLENLLDLTKRKYDHPDLYSVWKEIFLLSEKPRSSQWALLQHVPLVAWTAANAFRRTIEDGDELLDYLSALYDALLARQRIVPSAIGTRWRIVHVYGACGRDEIVEKLFEIAAGEGTFEGTQWIQYGAVRSLVEIAGKRSDQEACKGILGRLLGMMGERITPRSRAFGELRETAVLVNNPAWWSSAYSPILKRGEELAVTPEERDAWAKRQNDLKTP